MTNQCNWNNSFGIGIFFNLGNINESTEPANLKTQIGGKESNQCNCAFVGKRALSWATWIPGLSKNSLLAPINKEFSHEHIFLGDKSDNIGFGQHGLFNEKDASGYRIESECYDSEAMRKAISKQDEPSYYAFIFSNCQTYVERVLDTYRKLVGKNDK